MWRMCWQFAHRPIREFWALIRDRLNLLTRICANSTNSYNVSVIIPGSVLPDSAGIGMDHWLAGLAAEGVFEFAHVADYVVYPVAVQGMALS